MNFSNYITRFLKFHGWDIAFDQPDTAPTTVTNSRTWDNWMEAKPYYNRTTICQYF